MKFKNISLSLLALSLTVFVGCKDGEQETETNATTTQQETTTPNSNTTMALNPEHGQPGHTCALPVGAPLDQAAGNTMQQQQQAAPAPTSNVSPVRMNTSNATPTKNPPHGEPGHVCAVPVGADLN